MGSHSSDRAHGHRQQSRSAPPIPPMPWIYRIRLALLDLSDVGRCCHVHNLAYLTKVYMPANTDTMSPLTPSRNPCFST